MSGLWIFTNRYIDTKSYFSVFTEFVIDYLAEPDYRDSMDYINHLEVLL